DAGGREGVGLDDVGPGLEVGVVDLDDDLGLGEDEDVGVSLEIVRVVGEPGAAEVRLGQPVALHHGAHGAVEDEDALLQELFDHGVPTWANAVTTFRRGGRRSREVTSQLSTSKPARARSLRSAAGPKPRCTCL